MKRYLLKFILVIGIVFPSIVVMAQESPADYNPFVTANLDDNTKLAETSVTESSYHLYTINGDANYTDASTFVWYVENGTMGTYTAATDTWSPLPSTTVIGNGVYAELTGLTLDGTDNSSQIWVLWDDNSVETTGYIAVYERSSDECIFSDQITGYKHTITDAPEVWLIAGTRDECSDQLYSVTAEFNNMDADSYSYTLTYSYPGVDGTTIQKDTIFEATALVSNQLTWDLPGVNDIDVTSDEVYTITLDDLRDKYGTQGVIAPLGETKNQYSKLKITINHLPQTGTMSMD